jgi:hypothetical protein
MSDMSAKVAVVTGAIRGVGLGISPDGFGAPWGPSTPGRIVLNSFTWVATRRD